MSNQITYTVTEDAAYQLFKNLFRFKDIDAAKAGLQRAVESRYDNAVEGNEDDPRKAIAAESLNQRVLLQQLQDAMTKW